MDLTYKKQNVYALADEQELKAISDYAEGYKRFLDNGKTEREAVKETIEMIEKKGYKPYTLGDKINAGDKLYYNNRGKSLFIVRAGKADVAKNGVRILVAHVDSPRLDLKQVPLYEKADIAYFKTHYYGGIKKYQWLTIPLALHGVIALKDGTCVDVKVGDEEGDPCSTSRIFFRTLRKSKSQRPLRKDSLPKISIFWWAASPSKMRKRTR